MHFHKNAIISILSVNHKLKCLQCVSVFIHLIGNLGSCHWLFEERVYLMSQSWVTTPQRRLQTHTTSKYGKSCQHLELDTASYLLPGKLNGSGMDILCYILSCHPFCTHVLSEISRTVQQRSSSELENSFSLH